MKSSINSFFVAAIALASTACTSHYSLTNVSRTRLVVDSRYDATPNAQAAAFLAPYKHQVDSVMSPVVGMAAHDMDAARPESNLSNLLSDILVWAASKYYHEQPVLGIYNIGGIRAALSKGTVTYGDILAVAPFENKIAFTTLSGEMMLKLFEQLAARGGHGVSHGIELVISDSGKLISSRLHGKEISPEEKYRIVSIDYLVQGNDGVGALAEGTDVRMPEDEKDVTRNLIVNYFKEKAAQGEAVSAKVEGRIRIGN